MTRTERDSVGGMLRAWRTLRRVSQLELASDAGVSARHVSFIETGRAQPSRDMILRLAGALDVPLRAQNALLAAAGFAERYRERPLDAAAMEAVRTGLRRMLRHHEPYPAVVMDRLWNPVMGNGASRRMLNAFLEPEVAERGGHNLLALIFDPALLRPYVVNWPEKARSMLARAHREGVWGRSDPELSALIDRMLSYPGVSPDWIRPDYEGLTLPLLTLQLRKGDIEVDLFGTISTLGTPQDVMLQELRIESLFPADEKTERFFRALAAEVG